MNVIPGKQGERGVAVIIALALISLMLVFVMANSNALYQLNREIKLTDQRQRLHWKQMQAGTNNPPAESKGIQ